MRNLNILGAVAAPSPVTHSGPQDFTAAYTTTSGIAITGAPFTVDNSECRIVYVKYKPASTQHWKAPLVNGLDGVTMDAVSDVINVGGVTPPFTAGDTYEVGIQYQTKGYSSATDSSKTTVLNPDSENYGYETVADVSNEADSSTDFYVSMDGFKTVIVQYVVTEGNSDVVDLSVWGTQQADGTAAASCTYGDVTLNGMDNLAHTTTSGVYNYNTMLKTAVGSSYKYLKFNILKTGVSDDADYKIYVLKR